MKIIERTNSRGQTVILRSRLEGESPLQCTNEFDSSGLKTVGWVDGWRLYEDREGNQYWLDVGRLHLIDFSHSRGIQAKIIQSLEEFVMPFREEIQIY